MAEFGDFSRLLSNAQIQILQHDDFRLLPRIRLELRSSGLYYAASSGSPLQAFRGATYRKFIPKCRSGINTTRCVTAQKSTVLEYLQN